MCKTHLIGKTVNASNNDIWVLTKRNYIINDYGFQCFKNKNTRYMYESIFLGQSDSTRTENIFFSRVECLAMIESKMCDNKPMFCSNEDCFYNEAPNGEFSWLKNNIFIN